MRIRDSLWAKIAPLVCAAGLCSGTMAGGALAAPAETPASAPCQPHKIDLGNGISVTGGCRPLRIAYLAAATNNVYLQAGIHGAEDAAKAAGATITMFDANWQPSTQFNQAQNVIASGQYDAIVAEMNDGNQACAILSKDAPAKNILVTIANNPLCDRGTKEGDDLWTPGTLAFVGGSQGNTAFRDWLFWIAAQNPGPQKVAVLTGPELGANSQNTDLALQAVQKKDPDFHVVAVVRTDYSVLQGNQKSVPLLQANPDLTLLVSNYSDMTRGALQAARQVGVLGKLKIYDNGGNGWAFQSVKQGTLAATRVLTPYTEMYKAVQSVADAWAGKPVPRFIPLDSALITPATVDQYKPQY
jgi:ribose transport system substrate-binding protein